MEVNEFIISMISMKSVEIASDAGASTGVPPTLRALRQPGAVIIRGNMEMGMER